MSGSTLTWFATLAAMPVDAGDLPHSTPLPGGASSTFSVVTTDTHYYVFAYFDDRIGQLPGLLGNVDVSVSIFTGELSVASVIFEVAKTSVSPAPLVLEDSRLYRTASASTSVMSARLTLCCEPTNTARVRAVRFSIERQDLRQLLHAAYAPGDPVQNLVAAVASPPRVSARRK